ncbi:hypothetical protein GCM10023313_24960 [Mucilaginibacter defluvii]|uniref:Uncharacterized protein n=1 Tax=Mucilaginibacter defluvii TaxID=1196019 RepID=A0ABP9FXD1_9SPHI
MSVFVTEFKDLVKEQASQCTYDDQAHGHRNANQVHYCKANEQNHEACRQVANILRL